MTLQPFPSPDAAPSGTDNGVLRSIAEPETHPSGATRGSDDGTELDELIRMASQLADCPIAVIAAGEAEHFRMVAECGFGKSLVPREHAICRAIDHDTPLLMVADASVDARFRDDPSVSGANGVRFFLGLALFGATGLLLGVLCVADRKPRQPVSDEQLTMLRRLARIAARLLERRTIERSTRLAEQIANAAFSAVLVLDAAGTVVSMNPAARAMFGSVIDCGQSAQALFPPALQEDPEDVAAWLLAGVDEVDGSSVESRELRVHSPGREPRTVEAVRCTWQSGRAVESTLLLRDRHRPPAQTDTALQDPLTDTPNRAALLTTLATLLAQDRSLIVALLGLDNFRTLNDALGPVIGDSVLQIVASRLLARLPADAHLARFGGDEFAMVFPAAAATTIDAELQSLLRDIARPCEVDHHCIDIEASIGVARHDAVTDESGDTGPVDASELLARAGLAMRHAKRTGGQQSRWFEPGMRTEAIDRRRLDLELRRACQEGQFELHYQPQIDLTSGAPTGAEALLRWHHPERGLLLPAEFIDALSRSVIAPTVGGWIIQRACRDAADWPDIGGRRLAVGVNLFPVQFDNGRLLDEVDRALALSGLDPQRLELELTETIALRNDGVAEQLVMRLRARGVRVSFDDFGTGYASLSMLHRLQVDRVKIDHSFVRNVTESRGDEAIVRSIALMARNFDMQVIAEGVETESQAAFLSEIGCDEVQGFLYSRALAPADFHGWLGQQRNAMPGKRAHG